MDDGAVVASAVLETASLEQAIFTSLRSAMGQGYRIVAASAGVLAEEKREIVQRAPSHGNLCDSSADGEGLASYELCSGRRCILLACNAGTEQTARGGYRIHTHALVMEPTTFAGFHCDPFEVRAAALDAADPEWLRTPPTRLEPLSLSIRDPDAIRPEGITARPTPEDIDSMTQVLSAILGGGRLLVVGAAEATSILRAVLGATPLAARQHLSLSCGLRPSSSRKFQIVFAGADPAKAQRVVHDDDVDVLCWGSPRPVSGEPFEAWLHLSRRQWETGRDEELSRIASRLSQEHSADALHRVAGLCADIEGIGLLNKERLDQLALKYARETPQSEAFVHLLSKLRTAVEIRRAQLLMSPPTDSPFSQ